MLRLPSMAANIVMAREPVQGPTGDAVGVAFRGLSIPSPNRPSGGGGWPVGRCTPAPVGQGPKGFPGFVRGR
jgi:hypothetical protein